jgi:hypothetical protein
MLAPIGRSARMVVLGTLLGAAAGLAQTRPNAAIRGYVFDSLLTSTTVPGAVVTLTGPTTRTITADARGRFVSDSLEPGRYSVSFMHPGWREIGYRPPDQTIELRPGVYTSVFLSSTAGAEIAERVCGPREANQGAVLGALTDLRNNPIAGGEVRVEWNERLISKDLGLSSNRRMAKATTDSIGRYAICALPNDTPMLFLARLNGVDGPPLELDLKSRPLAIRQLTLDPVDLGRDSTAVRPRGTASLKGIVQATDGSALPEAQVVILGLDDATRTSAAGTFQLDSLPGGTRTIEIRSIGFGRHRQIVDLRPDRTAEVAVRLVRMAVVLPEVEVRVAARAAEFDQRRTNMAGAGHFMTQEEILRRNAYRTEDLFRTVPGFSVEPSGGFGYRIVSNRSAGLGGGRCSPEFYIDGVKSVIDAQVGGGLPVNPDQIYGIESYSGSATTPAEYQSQSGCGAILIWTRRGEKKP